MRPGGADVLVELGAGVSPVAVGGGRRDAGDFGGFGEGEAGEVMQVHQLRLARVVRGEAVEGFVDGEEFTVLFRGGGDFDFVHIDVLAPAAVARGEPVPGAVDEDAPHGLGGGGEKVGAVFKAPLARGLAAPQSQPCFVDEREQFVPDPCIAAIECIKEAGDVALRKRP